MCESHGLVPKTHPYGWDHPVSRDYGIPNYPCKATSCLFNMMATCVIPSKCEIGEDGRCKGYELRPEKKEERTGD